MCGLSALQPAQAQGMKGYGLGIFANGLTNFPTFNFYGDSYQPDYGFQYGIELEKSISGPLTLYWHASRYYATASGGRPLPELGPGSSYQATYTFQGFAFGSGVRYFWGEQNFKWGVQPDIGLGFYGLGLKANYLNSRNEVDGNWDEVSALLGFTFSFQGLLRYERNPLYLQIHGGIQRLEGIGLVFLGGKNIGFWMPVTGLSAGIKF